MALLDTLKKCWRTS